MIKYQCFERRGGVAHLGERLNGIQEVVGSIPIVSTNVNRKREIQNGFPQNGGVAHLGERYVRNV